MTVVAFVAFGAFVAFVAFVAFGVLVGTGVLIDMRRPSARRFTGRLTDGLTGALTDRQEIGKKGR